MSHGVLEIQSVFSTYRTPQFGLAMGQALSHATRAPVSDSTALDHEGSAGVPAPVQCDGLGFASLYNTQNKEKHLSSYRTQSGGDIHAITVGMSLKTSC